MVFILCFKLVYGDLECQKVCFFFAINDSHSHFHFDSEFHRVLSNQIHSFTGVSIVRLISTSTYTEV